MDIFGGIDGTSAEDNAEYAVTFEKSFTHKLYKNWHSPYASYVRGPFSAGNLTGVLANIIFQRVHLNYMALDKVRTNIHAGKVKLSKQVEDSEKIAKLMKKPRIFLAGYSRGGAAVVEICRLLKEKDIPVHCLILYDAVGMTHTVSQRAIPSNVNYCFHAMRDAKAGSRELFDVDLSGRTCESTHTILRKKEFMCTHGGMGGTLWKEGNTDSNGYIVEENLAKSAGIGIAINSAAAQVNRQTNITPKMDEDNSESVGIWMNSQIASVKIRNNRFNKSVLNWMETQVQK